MKSKNMAIFGRGGRFTAAALIAVVAITGCDAIDPTKVNNPTTTDADLAEATNPTEALLPGLRAQFARMINAYVVAEVVTDNYSIHGTGIIVDMDEPHAIMPLHVDDTDTSVDGVYWNVQELRALADFVINEIAPNDPGAPPALVAEAHYYRGMAYLTMGEIFSHVPHEEDGAPQPSDAALSKAISDLQAGTGFGPQANAALARAHRLLGDAGAAASAANAVLGAAPNFLFAPPYDEQFLANTSVFFLVLRALQEMQPLPRLDFLDPKYTVRSSPIPIAKAEEMHLILAEAALASGNMTEAGSQLASAITLAKSRGVVSFDDIDERRNADLSLRPRSQEIVVRADADSPYRAGLVLDRPSDGLSIPNISGTSLSADSVSNLGSADELWHALWLARQEILFLEGRRLADLGIKLPMMLREIDQNDNINDGDPGTVVVVPGYIPTSPRYAMDVYSPLDLYEGVEPNSPLIKTEVTVGVDMNKVLVANNVSPFGAVGGGEVSYSSVEVLARKEFTGAAAIIDRIGFLRTRIDQLRSSARSVPPSSRFTDGQRELRDIEHEVERLERILASERRRVPGVGGVTPYSTCAARPSIADAASSVVAMPQGAATNSGTGLRIRFWTEVASGEAAKHTVYITYEGDVNGHIDFSSSSCTGFFSGFVDVDAKGDAPTCASVRATHRLFSSDGRLRASTATDGGHDCVMKPEDSSTRNRRRGGRG